MLPREAGEKLEGWKAIAEHLGKSVRTAQRWEEEHGLPVHRQPDPEDPHAPPVFAHAAELDRWWVATFRNGTGDLDSLANGPGGSSMTPPASRTSLWLRRAVLWGIGALIAALAWRAQVLISAPRQPHMVRAVEVNEVGAFDEDGNLLWSQVFPYAVVPLPASDAVLAKVEDIDGDGIAEVLMAINKRGALPGARDGFYCFGATGELLWRFQPDRSIAIDHKEYENTFAIRDFDTGRDGSGHSFVVIAAVHRPFAPAQVAVVDERGDVVGEYWHYGYVTDLLIDDFDGDGVDEILLAGTNNMIADPVAARYDLARQQAVIALIEHDINGAIGPGPVRVPMGLRRGQELAYIAFPFPSVLDALAVGSFATRIEPSDQGFSVYVDSADGGHRGLIYTFDRRLDVIDVGLAEGLPGLHDSLVDEGLISIDLDEERDKLMQVDRLVWRLPETAGSR